MIELLSNMLAAVVNLLPDSPFSTLEEFRAQIDFLPYLNWFVPFDNALTVTRIWITAIFAYYVYDTVSGVIKSLIIDKLG